MFVEAEADAFVDVKTAFIYNECTVIVFSCPLEIAPKLKRPSLSP